MTASASNPWYVEVGGQAYGPYTLAQMHGFVTEGRIIAESHIARDIRGPFAYAASFPTFAPQLAPASAVAQMQIQTQNRAQAVQAQNEPYRAQTQANQSHAAQPVTRPGMTPSAPATRPSAVSPKAAPQVSTRPASDYAPSRYKPVQAVDTQPRVYMVMAEIQSGSAMRFLQTLQNFGRAQRVGDTVWILKSEASAEKLQDALSQTLTRQDRLFISATTEDHSAWFNLGADMDSRIRALWAE